MVGYSNTVINIITAFLITILGLIIGNIFSNILKIIFILIGIAIIVFTILAFKDWVPNIIAGLYIYKNNKVKIGDIIKVKGVKGKIIEMNLVETKIETNNNELIFIPNSNMVRYEVVKEVQDG